MPIDNYVGKVTLVQSWITATIPAFLSLAGLWEQISIIVASIIALIAVVYFIYLYFSTETREQLKKSREIA